MIFHGKHTQNNQTLSTECGPAKHISLEREKPSKDSELGRQPPLA